MPIEPDGRTSPGMHRHAMRSTDNNNKYNNKNETSRGGIDKTNKPPPCYAESLQPAAPLCRAPLLAQRPIQTTIMHRAIIRQHRNHTPANTHPPSQLLVAHKTVPFVCNRHVPISSPLAIHHTITNIEPRCYRNLFRLAQASHDARFVDEAVRRADTSAEIGLEGTDGEVVGD